MLITSHEPAMCDPEGGAVGASWLRAAEEGWLTRAASPGVEAKRNEQAF